MKACGLVIMIVLLFGGNAKGQQTDARQHLIEIQMSNKIIQEFQTLHSHTLTRLDQIESNRIIGPAQDRFSLLAAERNLELKPSLDLFQQVEMAERVWRGHRERSPEFLLQRVGDINFINFIQLGDFSRFILGQ